MASGIANLIGLVGAGLKGYGDGTRQRERDELERTDRQQLQEMRSLQISEAKRKIADEAAIREAGAPTQVTVNTPGDGMGPSAYMGAGSSFGTQEAADEAATKFNSPEATMARQGMVMDRLNPVGAPDRQAAAMKAQAAKLGLDEAELAHVKTLVSSSFGPLPNFDALSEAINKSPSLGGAGFNVEIGYSPDGKLATFRRKNPDGSLSADGVDFPNNEEGLLRAKQYAMNRLSVNSQLGFLKEQHDLKTAADKAASEEALKSAHADYYRKAGDALGVRAENSGRGKTGSAFERMDEADRLAYQDLNGQISEANKVILKARAEGSWDESSPNAKAVLESLAVTQNRAARLLAKYQGDQEMADPFGLRGSPSGQAADDSTPTSFRVNGNPGAFRKKLEQSKSPNRDEVLAAFDKQYPQAKPKITKQAVIAEMGRQPSRDQLMRQASQSRPPVDLTRTVKAQMGQGLSAEDIAALSSFNR